MLLTETLDVKFTGFSFGGRGLLDILVSFLFFGGILFGNFPTWYWWFDAGLDSMLSQKFLIDGVVFPVEFFLFLRLVGGEVVEC